MEKTSWKLTNNLNWGTSGSRELTWAWSPISEYTCQSAGCYSVLSSAHLSRNEYEISKLDLWIPAEALIQPPTCCGEAQLESRAACHAQSLICSEKRHENERPFTHKKHAKGWEQQKTPKCTFLGVWETSLCQTQRWWETSFMHTANYPRSSYQANGLGWYANNGRKDLIEAYQGVTPIFLLN